MPLFGGDIVDDERLPNGRILFLYMILGRNWHLNFFHDLAGFFTRGKILHHVQDLKCWWNLFWSIFVAKSPSQSAILLISSESRITKPIFHRTAWPCFRKLFHISDGRNRDLIMRSNDRDGNLWLIIPQCQSASLHMTIR